jgi:hypothetical protein
MQNSVIKDTNYVARLVYLRMFFQFRVVDYLFSKKIDQV